MWPHALWSNDGSSDGAQAIAVAILNLTGLALSVIAVVAYVHAQGRPRVLVRAAGVVGQLRAARQAYRARSRRLTALAQKAFLRFADALAGVLTALADTAERAADRLNALARRRDPRLG